MLDCSSSLWFLILQWVYALWQGMRNTRGFNLCYYTIQWKLFHLLSHETRKKKIVWVNPTHASADFRWENSWDQLRPKLMDIGTHNGFTFLEYKAFWYKVEYKGKYYWVHQDIFFELYCYDLSQCHFVKNLYDLDRNYSVAQRISEEEAMLLMFNKDMHLYNLGSYVDTTIQQDDAQQNIAEYARKRVVIHGQEFNIEFNSKLGAFLATIPLMLQARNMNAISAIASLALLAFDFLRTPIYKAYDNSFFYISKFVKLHVFGKRTCFYTAFGLFSDRWRYSDFKKGYAYLTRDGNEIEVTSYVSFLHLGDCELHQLKDYGHVVPDMQRFTIRDGVVSSGGFAYGQYSAVFNVRAGMYVS